MFRRQLVIFDKNEHGLRILQLDKKRDHLSEKWRSVAQPHARRCLQVNIEVPDKTVPTGSISPHYWIGEWEAATKRISREDSWCHIFQPTFETPEKHEWLINWQTDGKAKRRHNTDPLVLGNRFYYANCNQRHPKLQFLRYLAPGSMVLFGEYVRNAEHDSRTNFMLECVFVVEQSISYRPADLVALLEKNDAVKSNLTYRGAEIDEEFIRLSTLPLYYHSDKVREFTYQLYFGKSYSRDNIDYYSFIPCSTIPPPSPPVIDLPKCMPEEFITQLGKPGVISKEINQSVAKYTWERIRKEVMKREFSIGVSVNYS